MNYQEFIEQKRIKVVPSGFDVPESEINPMLFDFQRDIVRWNLRRGKSADFLDCGMGKGPILLEWSKQVHKYTQGNVLIFAPLAVSTQLHREGIKFGVDVNIAKSLNDIKPGVNVTNYERLHHYPVSDEFAGIVLDESSILKGQFGKIRKDITAFASNIPYRLACSATPAPNDWIELINHAEFFGIMKESEIKSLFFTQDGNNSNKFRLKRHAETDFWKWMAEWCIAMRKPSDLGYDDGDFVLPELNIHQETVSLENFSTGMLFTVEAKTLIEQRAAAKASLNDRVKLCADMVNNIDEPCIVWCNMNYESEALTKAIPGSIEVAGKHTSEYKEDALLGFSEGRYRVIISKPSICGHGMNWQHCSKLFYVGLSHSYEKFYQSVRRAWRFGQTKPVDVFIITSEADGAVVRNIETKERKATEMFAEIVRHMSPHMDVNMQQSRNEMDYFDNQDMSIPLWIKSYPDNDELIPGEFLYELKDTIGYFMDEDFKNGMIPNGESNTVMSVPKWSKEKVIN